MPPTNKDAQIAAADLHARLAARKNSVRSFLEKTNRQKPSSIAQTESILRVHLVPLLGAKQLDAITTEDIQHLKLRLNRSVLVWSTGLVWRLELALERRELEALRGPHEPSTSPFHSDVTSETDGEGTALSFPNEGSPLSLPFMRSAVWYNGWPAPRPIVVDVEASLEADQ